MRVLDWEAFVSGRLGEGFSGQIPPTAITIGVFDGVHRGHRALIERIIRRPPLVPLVITFKINPKEFLKKNGWEGDILSLDRKLAILENLGVGGAILIDFSLKFSKLTGKEFFELLRRGGNPGYVAIGSNFHCGYRMDTDAAQLRAISEEAGIPTEVIPPVLEKAGGGAGGGLPEPISSSRIRAAIAAGDLARARAMLGRAVEFDCTGLTGVPGPGGWFYPTDSLKRIKPAPGRYGALLFGRDFPEGRASEVLVEVGGIAVPTGDSIERIAFV